MRLPTIEHPVLYKHLSYYELRDASPKVNIYKTSYVFDEPADFGQLQLGRRVPFATICLKLEGESEFWLGATVCAPGDSFSREFGRTYAFAAVSRHGINVSDQKLLRLVSKHLREMERCPPLSHKEAAERLRFKLLSLSIESALAMDGASGPAAKTPYFVGAGWREREEDEVITKGDEYDSGVDWMDCDSWGGKTVAGARTSYGAFIHIRTKEPRAWREREPNEVIVAGDEFSNTGSGWVQCQDSIGMTVASAREKFHHCVGQIRTRESRR